MNQSYSTWAKEQLGIEVDPRLEIRELEGEDERGIYVKDKNIPGQSTLARVPFSSLLTIEQLPKFPILSKVAKLLTREDDILVLMLIHERHRGAKSKWYKHIECLPKQYHSIVNYDDNDLELIHGCNLYNVAKQWKVQIESDYQEVMQRLTSAGLCASPNSIFAQITLDLYRWCLCTIWSRFISIEYRPGKILRAMVPLIDFLNHHPLVEVGHHFHQADDYLYLVTGKDQRFKKNEELYLNYGPLSNSKLLMLYGFCLLENPFNEIDIWATMTTTTQPVGSGGGGEATVTSAVSDEDTHIFEKRYQILESLKIHPSRVQATEEDSKNMVASYQFPLRASDFVAASSDSVEEDDIGTEVISKHDLMVFLRLQYSDLDEVKRWSVPQWCALLANRQRLSIANERQALQSFQSAIEAMLAGYTRLLEEDEAILSTLLEAEKKKEQMFVHPSNHRVHAAMLTRCEKQLLLLALKKTNVLLAKLETEEAGIV